MDGLCAGPLRDLEDDVTAQVGLRGGRGTDGMRLVGLADMQRTGIGLAEDGDGGRCRDALRCG
jgi:hypothetical protein